MMHRFLHGAVALATALHLLAGSPALAQEQHVHTDTARTTPATVSDGMTLGISMDRLGSGTTWIPDAVRLPSAHFMAGDWMLMVHGWLFGQYSEQGGPRGSSQFGSLNWAMLMADRALAGGRLQLRFMPSIDPWTVGRCGYPLLLQSGETCHGNPLVDRQHPHDFFMELAAAYDRPITDNLAFLVYAAPAGEPALGPVAFMHRPSAMDEPQAPLGHHWQDATHISFGVVTAGLFTRKVRLEASYFNAHEPDEQRWNFDPIQLNSFSGRLTVNPNANWSFTAGYGALDNPEREPVPEITTRAVVSALHGVTLGPAGQWASAFVLGRNKHGHHDATTSALLETEAVLDDRNTVFSRFEYQQKTAHDLDLSTLPHEYPLTVSSLSAGYIRELVSGRGVTIGFGGRASVNFVPAELESAYGSRRPLGGMVFLRLRPSLRTTAAGGAMPGMHH
jgi:hypothetical protein